MTKSDTFVETGSTSIINAADWTINKLKSLGVTVPPSCRLTLARRLIQKVQDHDLIVDPDDEALLWRVAEAEFTILDQYLILRACSKKGISPTQAQKLEQMLFGAETVAADSNPLARNTEFELYVGALLTMGGGTVRLAEPDVRLRNGLMEAGIAAKRLTSPKKFHERIREGEKQIQRLGERGFVAVNIDTIVRNLDPDRELGDPDARFSDFLSHVECLDASITSSADVLGILYFGHTREYDFSKPKPITRTFSFRSFRISGEIDQETQEGWMYRFQRIYDKIDERLQAL